MFLTMEDTEIEGLEDFDKYKIGFTEYTIGRAERTYGAQSPNESPTPSDPNLSYNTPALVFAERSNKGAEHLLMDHSELLARQMSKSMSKIQTSIMDIKSEMFVRRKSITLLPGRLPTTDLPRLDSRMSIASMTSSASLPTIEVQQLPPLTQAYRQIPSLPDINFGLRVDTTEPIKAKVNKKIIKRKKSDTFQTISESKKSDSLLNISDPAMFKVVQTVRERKRQSENSKDTEQPKALCLSKSHVTKKTDKKDKSIELPRVTFSIGDDNPNVTGTIYTEIQPVHKQTWKVATDRLMNATRKVKSGYNMTKYQGKYSRSSSSVNLKMSYCQCSYTERAERDRIGNVMRRHTSNTKIGPVDFNKIKRQLGITRSNTMVW